MLKLSKYTTWLLLILSLCQSCDPGPFGQSSLNSSISEPKPPESPPPNLGILLLETDSSNLRNFRWNSMNTGLAYSVGGQNYPYYIGYLKVRPQPEAMIISPTKDQGVQIISDLVISNDRKLYYLHSTEPYSYYNKAFNNPRLTVYNIDTKESSTLLEEIPFRYSWRHTMEFSPDERYILLNTDSHIVAFDLKSYKASIWNGVFW